MRLRDVRIRNYRSIASQELQLGELTILFGKNDAGKSNVVKALEFAFGRSRQFDASNVHVSPLHPDPKDTTVVVDVRFVGNLADDFGWLLSFGENAFNTDTNGEITLSFRTEASYNQETRAFEKTRHIISSWQDEVIDSHPLPSDLLDSIDFILLDAHRDIAEVIRDRYSRWNQEVRKADIADQDAQDIESKLAELGKAIVEASPFLTAAETDLKGATDHRASRVEIAPVARSLNELYRSLDVLLTEGGGPSISVSDFGAGTRSRAEFMAYKALIDIAERDAKNNGMPYYCLAAFEEPEAHIHPQSQQQLLSALEKLGSQRLVTTHSPYLLAKSPMSSLMHVKRVGGDTSFMLMDIDLTEEQRKETERYLLKTRGEMLFADAVVLAEGESEEQALPIFFERVFGEMPFVYGVTIVTCSGNNYEPFIRIAEKLAIPWFIFSDAEAHILDAVRKQAGRALGQRAIDFADYSNIVTCQLGNDYEAELIADGYAEEMLAAIRSYDDTHQTQAHVQTGKRVATKSFDRWKEKTNGQPMKGGGQHDYDGPEGELRALEDFMNISENKIRYAAPIADEIAGLGDNTRCVPSCVRTLFGRLDTVLGISRDEEDEQPNSESKGDS